MTQQMDTAGVGRGGRMSRQRKRDTVLRLLQGEDLDTVSRSLGMTAATLRNVSMTLRHLAFEFRLG
jgi:transposase